MSDAGYTLAETLVALTTIGLALGGLSAAVRVVGQDQLAASRGLAHSQDLKAAQASFSALMAGQGPFVTGAGDGLSGDPSHFVFPCGEAKDCSAEVTGGQGGPRLATRRGAERRIWPLSGLKRAHLVYVGSQGAGPDWPTSPATPETLRAVVLVGEGPGGEGPLAIARVWPEQSSDCVFDPIDGQCRKAAP